MEGADNVSATIVVSDLHLKRGERLVLDGVSLEVGRGDVIALMGASGSGKTTMLRVIAGLERFERGVVDVDGVGVPAGAPTRHVLAALRRKVGMVFQFHCLFEHLSALQNVCLAPVHVQRASVAEAQRRGRELLEALGVEHRANALPRELSGGEAQRVAIARALATDPPVLLMDEPTASLDPARREELAALLRTLVATDHRTLVVATHDAEFAEAVASRVVVMKNGRIAPRVEGIRGEP